MWTSDAYDHPQVLASRTRTLLVPCLRRAAHAADGVEMTASELIELLEDLDPDTEVRIAQQPSWPFEYTIDALVGASETASETQAKGLSCDGR